MSYYSLKINLGGIEMNFDTQDVSVVRTQIDEYFNLLTNNSEKSAALSAKMQKEPKIEPAKPQVEPQIELWPPQVEQVVKTPEPVIEKIPEPKIETIPNPPVEQVVEQVVIKTPELITFINETPAQEVNENNNKETLKSVIFDRADQGSDYKSEVKLENELEEMIKYNLEYVQKELLSSQKEVEAPQQSQIQTSELQTDQPQASEVRNEEVETPQIREISSLEIPPSITPASETTPCEVTLMDFMKLKVSHSLFDDFLITAFFIKNILRQENFSIKNLNSKLYAATEKLVDYTIIEDVLKCGYISVFENADPGAPTLYTITPRGEYYYNSLKSAK